MLPGEVRKILAILVYVCFFSISMCYIVDGMVCSHITCINSWTWIKTTTHLTSRQHPNRLNPNESIATVVEKLIYLEMPAFFGSNNLEFKSSPISSALTLSHLLSFFLTHPPQVFPQSKDLLAKESEFITYEKSSNRLRKLSCCSYRLPYFPAFCLSALTSKHARVAATMAPESIRKLFHGSSCA